MEEIELRRRTQIASQERAAQEEQLRLKEEFLEIKYMLMGGLNK